jgi:2-oxoglutarate ferredoxin oxidoreductase subunit beta
MAAEVFLEIISRKFYHETSKFKQCVRIYMDGGGQMLTSNILDYFRDERLPTVWCPGCGNGIVLRAFAEAMSQLKYSKDEVAVVSGIGCSSRATGYLDFNTLHTLHGRAIAFATGVKLARPDLKVIVMSGDGDALAIGGNHLIHACRRNIDITIIVFNNNTYGMTGGQHSPTTPERIFSTTAPYGTIERQFDVVELARSAGASYIARATTYHYNLLVKILVNAISHKGFSVVDVFTQCPTYFGRYSKKGTAPKMLEYFKETAVTIEKAKNMSPEDLKGKFVIGELYKEEREDYCSMYEKIKELAKAGENSANS